MNRKEKYIDGLDMKQFEHIPKVSSYNRNYYFGFDKDLLFAKSDDDNFTEWYIIDGVGAIFLGESYTSQGEKLHAYKSI